MDVVTLALAKKGASAGEKGEKGDTGVGVESITSTNNTADGGTSVITVTLTDGSKSTFNVKNGSKGSTGIQGPKGDKGETGAKGDKGETGAKGDTGATPKITIGTVTTGAAGTKASATITGTTPNLVLNLTIPQGAKGATGATGTVANYESRIATLEAELEACKGEKESLQARLNDIESRLTALETPAQVEEQQGSEE